MSGNLDTNKLAAAILLAGLIGMITGKVTEFLYDGGPAHPGGHHEEARGYKIDVPEVAAEGGAAGPVGAADISALYAAADAKAGETYFTKKCTVCHTIESGGPNKVGPNLHGVLGRKVASHGGFSYSDGMKAHSDRSWSWDELNHYLWNPKKHVPGTIMAFAGEKKDQDRANLIVYLNSQGSNQALPPVTAKAEETAPEKGEAATAGEAKKEEKKEAAPAKH